MNTRHIPSLALLAASGLLIVLSVIWVPNLIRLNQYSLQTGALMIEQNIAPGWWLNPDKATTCTPPLSIASGNGMIGDRLQRLYGLQSLVCGEIDQGTASLTATATRLTSDPTLPLLLAKEEIGTTENAVGVNTLAERARQAYTDGDREAAARWLDSGSPFLYEPSQFDNQAFYFAACYIYRGLQRLDDSLRACQHYVTVNPNNKEAWNHLGATYMAMKDWSQAETALRTAITLDDSWLPAQDNLVTVLYRHEQTDAALSAFAQARQNAPDDAWSAYWLARMALQLGLCADAHSYFTVAQATDSPGLQAPIERLATRLAEACP